jgi:hypothetical protein
MVAVLIVAVLMVAVEIEAVPSVAVPVERVKLPPKVTLPDRRLAPSTAKVPLLFTPVVEIWRADVEDSSPLATARSVPVNGVVPTVFRTCG